MKQCLFCTLKHLCIVDSCCLEINKGYLLLYFLICNILYFWTVPSSIGKNINTMYEFFTGDILMIRIYFNYIPNNIMLNSFIFSTMVSTSFSVTVHLVSSLVSFLILDSIGMPPWIVTAHNCTYLVYIYIYQI